MAAAGPARADMDIAGAMGLQLSDPLADMQRVVHDLISTGKISRSQVQLLSASIEAARRIAMQGQQLARLARGKLRQSHERLNLDAVIRQALAERMSFFQQRRVSPTQDLERVELVVDPGVLSSLIETALDWIVERNQDLSVQLRHGAGDGARAELILRATLRSDAAGAGSARRSGEDAESERLSWYLLVELARAMGAHVVRDVEGDTTELGIGFPRTVRQLEGLAAVDSEHMGTDSWLASDSRSMAGLQVMLVTGDAELAVDVTAICQNMGLHVVQAASSQMAARLCETGQPNLIVVDERSVDARFETLLGELLAANPQFPSIEIARDANSLAMTSWMGDVTTRISLDSVRAQLPQALTLELARAS